MYRLNMFNKTLCVTIPLTPEYIKIIDDVIKKGILVGVEETTTDGPQQKQYHCRKDINFAKVNMSNNSSIDIFSCCGSLCEYIDLTYDFRLMIDNYTCSDKPSLVLKVAHTVYAIRDEKDTYTISTSVSTVQPRHVTVNIISPLIEWLLFIGINQDDIYIPREDSDIIKKIHEIKSSSCK